MQQTETKQTEKSPAKKAEAPKKGGKLAVVLLRSLISIKPGIKHTIKMLGLERKNVCVVVDDTPSNRGMLTKVKDYVTWGEIDAETLKEMESKRGEGKGFYRLHPPRGGFERKGIKKPFTRGGALGYRKDKMNDLLRRML